MPKRDSAVNSQQFSTMADKKIIFLEPYQEGPVNSLSINLLGNVKQIRYDTEQGFIYQELD